MRKSVLIASAALGLAALGACAKDVKPPFDPGVCYAVALPEKQGDEVRFNRLSENEPQMETCAAQLEAMRIRFLRLGGNQREVVGAYQGRFIFIDRGGVYLGKTLEGPRFFALARTGDGRLAVPGAIEQAPRPLPGSRPAE